jgi:hypothetical protein
MHERGIIGEKKKKNITNPLFGVIYEASSAIIEVGLWDIALPPMWEALDVWA